MRSGGHRLLSAISRHLRRQHRPPLCAHRIVGQRDAAKYAILGMPLAEQGARFLRPCRFDDDIVVESKVEEWGRTSFTVRHRILNQGKLAVDGFEKRVWAIADLDQPGKIKPVPLPQEIVACLSDRRARRC